MGDARILGNAVQVAVGEQPLCQRREADESHSVLLRLMQDALFLGCTVEQVVASLVDEAGYIVFRQVSVAEGGGFGWPSGDAHIECLSLAHDIDESLQGFFQRCFGVEAVDVEQVHVVQVHSSEALVEAGHEVLARAPVAIRSGPHVISRLGRDE